MLPPRIVVVAKHLCGCGTDYALKSMTSVLTATDGCVFATCCHGVCNWNDYVGRDTLVELFNKVSSKLQEKNETHTFPSSFGQREFGMLRRWAAGTVCCGCSTSPVSGVNQAGSSIENASVKNDEHPNMPVKDRFGHGMRQLIEELNLSCGVQGLGRCCQRIIDYGRMVYMRETLGFNATDMIHFVDESISPQNALLIGTRKQ